MSRTAARSLSTQVSPAMLSSRTRSSRSPASSALSGFFRTFRSTFSTPATFFFTHAFSFYTQSHQLVISI